MTEKVRLYGITSIDWQTKGSIIETYVEVIKC